MQGSPSRPFTLAFNHRSMLLLSILALTDLISLIAIIHQNYAMITFSVLRYRSQSSLCTHAPSILHSRILLVWDVFRKRFHEVDCTCTHIMWLSLKPIKKSKRTILRGPFQSFTTMQMITFSTCLIPPPPPHSELESRYNKRNLAIRTTSAGVRGVGLKRHFNGALLRSARRNAFFKAGVGFWGIFWDLSILAIINFSSSFSLSPRVWW